MLTHGADAALVQAHVTALAQRLGYDVQLLVLAEGLLLTIEDGRSFRTKLGHVVSGMNVNMSALIALDEIVRQAPAAAIDRRLDAVEHAADCYPRWLVVLGMGLTAASLSRLFGGTWPVVGVSALVGVVNLLVRQVLSHWSMNPIAIAGLTALTSGLVGALLMRLFPEDSPTLCLVAAGMILVPGVPLLNGVREMLGSHVVTGIARLMVGTVTVLSIAFGLFIAARIAGDAFSIDAQDSMLPVHEDFIFSALATLGFAMLFNVPPKAGWVCIVCGMAGHGFRSALGHLGLGLIIGTVLATFTAAMIARLLGHRFRVPAVTFVFPGVVAMVPGSYAFRAGIGGIGIMNSGSDVPMALISGTIGLALTAVLVTAAIAIGLSLALATQFTLAGEQRAI
jgi:uncharacterized membrane protein YjjP (DUF1212 family)